MITKDESEVVDTAGEFEQALQTLVLEAFSKGVLIEGEWSVALPAASVPNWTVEFRKHRAEHGAYTPEFIEE